MLNCKSAKKKKKNCTMPFKGLAFFADVKRKVVKTQKFLHKSMPAFVKYSFPFTCKNESFLHKSSSDVITTVLVQLNVN